MIMKICNTFKAERIWNKSYLEYEWSLDGGNFVVGIYERLRSGYFDVQCLNEVLGVGFFVVVRNRSVLRSRCFQISSIVNGLIGNDLWQDVRIRCQQCIILDGARKIGVGILPNVNFGLWRGLVLPPSRTSIKLEGVWAYNGDRFFLHGIYFGAIGVTNGSFCRRWSHYHFGALGVLVPPESRFEYAYGNVASLFNWREKSQ